MATGDAYYGYSGARKFNPSRCGDIYPDVQTLIENTQQAASNAKNNPYASTGSFERWPVNNCAEVHAVNNALRGGADLDNIFLNTKSFKTGEYAPPCKNCQVTFEGFKMPNNVSQANGLPIQFIGVPGAINGQQSDQ